MLEGLEISEYYYNEALENKDFRVDSDFFTKPPKINSALEYRRIGDILLHSQYGISIEMNEENSGYPIYRMNEIHSMLCDLEVNKCADTSREEKDKFVLNNKDVLFNRTNSYEWVGRTGVYYKNNSIEHIFASYLVKFVPDSSIIKPEYLAAFLSSKFGVWDIKRRARHSINQTNVNPEEVKAIQIPILADEIQLKIESLFETANFKRVEAADTYQQAENLLLATLGLNNFSPSNQNHNTKSFSQSFGATGRLDAEYYQTKYELVVNQIMKHSWQQLAAFITDYSTGYPYKSDDYVEKSELPLIRINNLKKGQLDLSNSAYLPNEQIALSKKDVVHENDLLISMSGTIGNCCIVPSGITAVVNQRIMRIATQNYNPLVLMLIINSIVGEYQLKRIGTGGVQTNISSGDISNIIIPIIDTEAQTQIAEQIQQSFKLKAQSEHLLEVAKRAVEIAIEQNEEVAMAYLSEQTQGLNHEPI